jgi:ankyrin repeat protein
MKLSNQLCCIVLSLVFLFSLAGCGSTSLNNAVASNDYDAVQRMIADGVDVNERSSHGSAPIHFAVRNNNEQIVQSLIEAGANLNARTIDSSSLFRMPASTIRYVCVLG